MASAPCFAFEPHSGDECIERLSRVSLRITLVEQNHFASGTSRLYPSTGQSIISSYSALRPLMQADGKSPTAASRDHRIWVDHALGCACEQSSAEIDLVLRLSGGVPA